MWKTSHLEYRSELVETTYSQKHVCRISPKRLTPYFPY